MKTRSPFMLLRSTLLLALFLVGSAARAESVDRGLGWSELMIATARNDSASVEHMIRSGADLAATDRYMRRTALHIAAQEGRIEILRMLLRAGADMAARDAVAGSTPLHLAASEGRVEVVNELISAGADAHAPDAFGMTALDIARVARGETSAPEANEPPAAPLSEIEIARNMEFIYAVRGGDIADVRSRIGAGVDPDWRSVQGGLTALMLAAINNDTMMVEALLESGATVDAADHTGFTAMMHCAAAGRDSMVERLLSHGAAVVIRNNAGSTATFLAALKGHASIVRMLLKAGADPNAMTDDRTYPGWTPLMAAAAWGHTRAVIELLDGGADFRVKNRNGWTALKFAKANGRTLIAEMLRNVGAKE